MSKYIEFPDSLYGILERVGQKRGISPLELLKMAVVYVEVVDGIYDGGQETYFGSNNTIEGEIDFFGLSDEHPPRDHPDPPGIFRVIKGGKEYDP